MLQVLAQSAAQPNGVANVGKAWRGMRVQYMDASMGMHSTDPPHGAPRTLERQLCNCMIGYMCHAACVHPPR